MRIKSTSHEIPNRRSSALARPQAPTGSRRQQGFTILELLFAAAILLITIAGVASLFGASYRTNHWQGDLSTRTIEYAQDKMESLLALNFDDTTADTTQFPACVTPSCTPSGTGLSVGGSSDWQSPATGYVDYLDATGNQLSSSAGASYIRVWQVSINTSGISTNQVGNVKQITVVAAVLTPAGGNAPSTKVVCFKNNQ